MFSRLSVVLLLSFCASAVAQSPSVVCVAGQCLQGFSNVTLGAKLSAPGAPASIQLLPGQYTSTTNPQLLHSLLTASSATLSSSPGFENASVLTLPLDLQLQPGLAIYASPLFSGQPSFSELPSSPILNSSTPLSASSVALSNNVWIAVTSGSSQDRVIIWETVPDIAQLPSSSLRSLNLVDIQSSSCSPPCSGNGVCSASGTCTCPPGFAGSSCESCADGFFGPACQACPEGCTSCDQGMAGSGRCLKPIVANAPSSCNCVNGQCGPTGQCDCLPGWTTADDGTACGKCADGFFLNTTGECQVCQLGCDKCADGSATCITCKSGFTQDPNVKTKCNPLPSVNSNGLPCPEGSYSDNGRCAVCSATCRTCTGPSSNQCVFCARGSYLFNGNCVSANSEGVCEGTNGMIADNIKNECDTCGSKCTSCRIQGFDTASTIDQLQCTGCLPGAVLSNGRCIDNCPAGTFVSPQDNLTCIPCSSSCGTCSGSADFCLTCSGNQLASSGQCVSTCPSGTFTSEGSCLKCHPDCESCSGPNFNQCSTCSTARPVLSSGRCLPTCTKSQYFDKTSGECQSCDSSCSSCSGAGSNNCLACSSSTQVLRGGSCVAANCEGSNNVIPGLGICLSELVRTSSTSGSPAPLPSITGVSDPTVINTRKSLEWWQILLMALGCAFIFVVILWCWRRRARKQRAKRTQMFAASKNLNKGSGWRWRLLRFGEKLFGHRKSERVNKRTQRPTDVLPVYRDVEEEYPPVDERLKRKSWGSRHQKKVSDEVYGEDINMKEIRSSSKPNDKNKDNTLYRTTSQANSRSRSKRETVDDLIDAYDYSIHSRSRSPPRAPSTLPGLDERAEYTRRLKQRIQRDSLYAEYTGNQRNSPEPRQPLRREASSASRFTENSVSSWAPPKHLKKAGPKEAVLVDVETRSTRSPPLQMATEAQEYMMSVRAESAGPSNSAMPLPLHSQQMMLSHPVPTFAASSTAFAPASTPMNINATAGAGGYVLPPIPVTLTPNSTGGYWLTPVPQQYTVQQQQQQFQNLQSQQGQQQDTVVLQPDLTGGSRNPFRQGSF